MEHLIEVGFVVPDGVRGEPRHLNMPAVPRIGETVVLNTGRQYKVKDVHWGFTDQGLQVIDCFLE